MRAWEHPNRPAIERRLHPGVEYQPRGVLSLAAPVAELVRSARRLLDRALASRWKTPLVCRLLAERPGEVRESPSSARHQGRTMQHVRYVIRSLCPFLSIPALSAGDAMSARYVDVTAMHARADAVERRIVEETDTALARQYRVLAIALRAEGMHAKPFTGVELSATFIAPSGARFTVPGFYDGDGTWKVRFMPYEVGVYRWTSAASPADPGLHARQGTFTAAVASGDDPMAKHGGHLRVGPNKRHLTYTDGTPFFWLGDTWWFVPTSSHPYDSSSHPEASSMYQLCVQLREKQRYNMLTVGFLGDRPDLLASVGGASSMEAGGHGKDDLFGVDAWNEASVAYWRQADRFLLYADEAGMGMTMNMIWNKDVVVYSEKVGADRLVDHLWPIHRYVIARLGSYNVIWHVIAEYNHSDIRKAGLIPQTLELGRRMRELDPYQDRPLTIFPWPASLAPATDAWQQPWHGFKLCQGGHYKAPWQTERAEVLRRAFETPPIQPVLIGEHNFEGIFDKQNDDGDVRAAAWRAMMSGSCGVTYGATGLWYPNKSEADRRDWHWGNNAWYKALEYPGAAQLGVLRGFFETLPWWQMRPLPTAVSVVPALTGKKTEHHMPTAAAFGDRHIVCYIPGALSPTAMVRIAVPEGSWTWSWFDPRTGARAPGGQAADGQIGLPPRPDRLDWAMLAERAP